MITGKDIDKIGTRLGQIAARETALQATSEDLEEATRLQIAVASLPSSEQQRVLMAVADMQLFVLGRMGLMGD